MKDKYFFKEGVVYAFSQLQIAEGMAQGLQELTGQERNSHLNPVVPVAQLLDAAKNELRPLRDKFLSRVADIGAAAFATGHAELANEVFAEPGGVRRKLLDITDDPALNAATTREDMEAAVLTYYAGIVSTVSPELRGAFKELEK